MARCSCSCGAYALAQNAHVRGDFLYSSMRPRTQASLDLVLYMVFFFPASPHSYTPATTTPRDSWRIAEHSTVTADGPPIYHFKTVIPIAGALVMLQGMAEIVRCIVCLKTGEWPSRLQDVSETDVIEEQLAPANMWTRSRERSQSKAPRTSKKKHARAVWAESSDMSDPALGL